jgi:hypothetical protein
MTGKTFELSPNPLNKIPIHMVPNLAERRGIEVPIVVEPTT